MRPRPRLVQNLPEPTDERQSACARRYYAIVGHPPRVTKAQRDRQRGGTVPAVAGDISGMTLWTLRHRTKPEKAIRQKKASGDSITAGVRDRKHVQRRLSIFDKG